MPLSLRLTLSIVILLAVLAAMALFGLNALTSDMRQALGETASEVGHSLITILREERQLGDIPGQRGVVEFEHRDDHASGAAPDESARRKLRVVLNGRELSPEEIERLPDHALRHPPAAPVDGKIGEVDFEVEAENNGPRPALRVRGLRASETLIPIPQSRTAEAIAAFRQRIGWGLLALLLVGATLATLLARRIATPLQALGAAAARVGRGEPHQPLQPSGPPEVRQSIEAFNRMALDLQRLQAETEALRADRELAELGEIGRGLAHSLRNPLHALGLSLDALSAGNDHERGAALTAGARDQLARIDQALRGFLALSASAGASVETVSLDEVIDDVVLEASQRAQGQVHIERERSGLQLPAVSAELRIMIHALVINALEASPGGGRVRVRALASAGNAGLQVEVHDQGPGILASVRSKLFQPHVSSKPSGAGMGLYLTERLARLRYRGSLELQARDEGGTLAVLLLNARETVTGAAHAQ